MSSEKSKELKDNLERLNLSQEDCEVELLDDDSIDACAGGLKKHPLSDEIKKDI